MSHYARVTAWFFAHPRLWSATVGVLIGVPFLYPLLLPFAYAGLFLLWRLIYLVPRPILPSALMLVFGVKALIYLSWGWSTIPITWLPGLSLTSQVIGVSFYWFTAAVWLAVAGLLLAIISSYILPCRKITQIWGLPVAVIIAEYFGALVFSICMYGVGGEIGGGFSFGHSGYLFPWLYPAAVWWGVYGVGFFGLLFVSMVHDWYQSKRWQVEHFVATGVLVLGVGFAFYTLPVSPTHSTIALVQTDSSQGERANALESLVQTSLATGASYVLLPEGAQYLADNYEVSVVGPTASIEAWRIIHPTSTAMIIDSSRTMTVGLGDAVQRAYIWDDKNIYASDKSYLVPQGEYMPYLYTAALRLFGLGPVADWLHTTINYVPGVQSIPHEAPLSVPNVLFCFESVSPLAAKKLITTRPSEFIMHPMSHSWFHQPTTLWVQLETMLRFQAVHAGVPIVSAGNDVRGAVYLPNGTVLQPETVFTNTNGTVDVI